MSEMDRKVELLKLAQSIMREEHWSEAIRLLKENSSVAGKHWELLWNVGWCYFKLERMDEARKYLRRATRLAPENHVCKYGLGQVYLKQKQYKKAESILSEALQIKESHSARIGLAFAYLAQGRKRRDLVCTAFLVFQTWRLGYSYGYGLLCESWVKAPTQSQVRKFSA